MTAPEQMFDKDPERPLELREKSIAQAVLMERSGQNPEDWVTLHADAFHDLMVSRPDLRAKLRADFNTTLDEIEQILNRPSRLPRAA